MNGGKIFWQAATIVCTLLHLSGCGGSGDTSSSSSSTSLSSSSMVNTSSPISASSSSSTPVSSQSSVQSSTQSSAQTSSQTSSTISQLSSSDGSASSSSEQNSSASVSSSLSASSAASFSSSSNTSSADSAPTLHILTSQGSFVNASTVSNFAVRGTCSPEGGEISAVNPQMPATADCSAGEFLLHLDLSALPAGSSTVMLQLTAANASPTSKNLLLIKDTRAPKPRITAKPFAVTRHTAGSLTFSSTDADGTGHKKFQCALNSTSYQDCTSSLAFSNLTGRQTLRLRAQDMAGNTSEAITYSWTILTETEYLNVLDFGAIGDGATDDTDAISAAFAAVKAQKKSLYFPQGTYLVNKSVPSAVGSETYRSLIFDAGGLSGIAFFGEGSTSHITTALSNAVTLLYVFAWAPNNNFTITGLNFSSTHEPATTYYQSAIFLQGGPAQSFKFPLLSGNIFSGFGTTFGGQGLADLEISDSSFLSPRGHDDSKISTSPAVNIWLFDNQNGYCSNVKILNNYANGYTGSGPMSTLITRRAMDGFLYGQAYGILVSGNHTTNFTEEHIALWHQSTFPETTAEIVVTDNIIEAGILPNSFLFDGTRKLTNWGIRIDASHVTIAHNHISNFTTGVLVRTYESQLKLTDINISDNIMSSASDPLSAELSAGIYIIGSAANLLEDIHIHNNNISSAFTNSVNYRGIFLSFVNNATVYGNELSLTAPQTTPRPAISYGTVENILHKGNIVTGTHIPYALDASSDVTFLD